MLSLLRLRRDRPQALFVSMTGVRLGDEVAQIGCAHGPRAAAVAAKVGLSGRVVVFVADEGSESRARRAAAATGVLLEVERTDGARIPSAPDTFDLVIVDDTGGLLSHAAGGVRSTLATEAFRILRPGGRVLALGSRLPAGVRALLARAESVASIDAEPVLRAGGFGVVRTLAERDGLVFVEGLKPRV